MRDKDDAAPKADLCASCSEKPMPDDREADKDEAATAAMALFAGVAVCPERCAF